MRQCEVKIYTFAASAWSRKRTFPGIRVIGKGEGALKVAKELEDKRHTIWMDESGLDAKESAEQQCLGGRPVKHKAFDLELVAHLKSLFLAKEARPDGDTSPPTQGSTPTDSAGRARTWPTTHDSGYRGGGGRDATRQQHHDLVTPAHVWV